MCAHASVGVKVLPPSAIQTPTCRCPGNNFEIRINLLHRLPRCKNATAMIATPCTAALRYTLMMLAYETILLSWLNLYGYMVSRVGQSRFGTRVREILQGVTGIVLIALGVRLAFEQK